MIDRENIQIVVFDGRGPNGLLARWLLDWPGVWYASKFIEDQSAHIADQRNTAARKFLKESHRPWLLMIDDDMVPRKGVEEVLASPSAVTGTWYWGETGQIHSPDGECGAGFLKLSRVALRMLGAA